MTTHTRSPYSYRYAQSVEPLGTNPEGEDWIPSTPTTRKKEPVYTVDMAGGEPIKPGKFGIPHGTEGWFKGEKYIFDTKYGTSVGQWRPLQSYQDAKKSHSVQNERPYRWPY